MKLRLMPLMTITLLIVLVALPLLFILLQAIFPALSEGSFSGAFTPVAKLFQDPALGALLAGTLKTGLGVALCSSLIGVPLGALRGLFNVPQARFWDLMFLIPFLTPPYIAALSWMLALQQNGYLQQLTGWNLNELLFSQAGIILVMTLNIFPVIYFAVSRSMLASGDVLPTVARVHGASPWRAFWHISLPMALPALAAGVLLAFTLAIEEYGVPAALGSRAGVVMLTVGIEERLADWPIDLPGSALLSMILVLIALAAFFLQRKLTGNREVTSITGKPARRALMPPGRWRVPILLLFSLTALIVVALPVTSLFLTAFLSTLSGGLQLSNLSLSHFSALFAQQGEALSALSTSVGLALGTALITGVLGFLAAWLVVEGKIRGAKLIDALSLLPVALPGVVVGVGLILLWNRPFWPVSPYNTWTILLLSYCCLLLPWPVRYVSSALKQIGSNLEAAARVHGAGSLQALRYIIFPLVSPSLLAAMLMVFAIASRELVTSLLLAPAGTQTVAVFIWRQFEQGSVGQGMAMASIALTLSLTLMLAAMALLQKQAKGSDQS